MLILLLLHRASMVAVLVLVPVLDLDPALVLVPVQVLLTQLSDVVSC